MNESSPDNSYGASAPTDPFQAAKASAMKAAEELRHAASQKAQELKSAAEGRTQQLKEAADAFKETAGQKAEEFKEAASEAWSEARGKYEDLRAQTERLAREKPMQTVLTAFGVGLFIGLILRR